MRVYTRSRPLRAHTAIGRCDIGSQIEIIAKKLSGFCLLAVGGAIFHHGLV